MRWASSRVFRREDTAIVPSVAGWSGWALIDVLRPMLEPP